MGDLLNNVLGERFFDLLEAQAKEACQSVRLLSNLAHDPARTVQELSTTREKDRDLVGEIENRLASVVMAGLKKEDIGALCGALSRVPEAAERFARRWTLAPERLDNFDLAPQQAVLLRMAESLVELVRQLRVFDNSSRVSQLHAEIQQTADTAERLAEENIEALVRSETDPITLVMRKDAIEHLATIADLCAECGNLVDEVVLKYA